MKRLYHASTCNLIKIVYPGLIWDFYNKTNAVFLTFDDGPTPDVTDKVLDILKYFNAKATFFCIGKNVQLYPDIFHRTIKEGHAVGNHGYSHVKGWYTKNKDYFNDIDLARKYIDSDLFRPPHGKIGFSQIGHIKRSYKIIMWDIMSFDFDPDTTVQECVDNVLKNVRAGSIVTFHDTLKASKKVIKALPLVIESILEQGIDLTHHITDQLRNT